MNSPRNEAKAQRLTQAAEWLLRLNSDTRSELDLTEWLRWCEADADNVAAYQSLQRDWQDLGALKPASRRVFHWRAAAAVLVAVTLTASLAAFHRYGGAPQVQQVAADINNKTATLPDGSIVVLGARTHVDMDFSAATRQVNLSEGEAYFKVHHDKNRPFVVHAGPLAVTAVGTAFDMRSDGDRVIVTVEEGTVEIAGGGVPPGQWRATAGYQLTYSRAQHLATLASVNPAAILKWRSGELSYDWQSLAAVIADLNRYSSRKIILNDPVIANEKFTGTVFISSIDDWLKGIQDTYPVRAEEAPNGDIILQPKSPAEFRKFPLTR
jgi:transmembrane sensor